MPRMVSELTKLGLFLVVQQLRPLDVAKHAGISRQFLGRLRFGEAEATRPMMIRIAKSCTYLLRRKVTVAELFDLGGPPVLPPRIETIDAVTAKHGNAFAEEWFRQSLDTGVIWEACSSTRILTWPGEDGAAQDHHHRLVVDIGKRTMWATKRAISEAFVKAATAVLARERRRR